MTNPEQTRLSVFQRITLVTLRTCIGWHFLYEGYFKLILPAWASDGTHLGKWSSASYLNGATGPIGHLLHAMFNAGWGPVIDVAVIAALLGIGLSLMLGLFTQSGCDAALGHAHAVLCYSHTAGRRSSCGHGRQLHDRKQDLDRVGCGCRITILSNRADCRTGPTVF